MSLPQTKVLVTGCGVRQDERASIPSAEREIEYVDEFVNLGGFDWQDRC